MEYKDIKEEITNEIFVRGQKVLVRDDDNEDWDERIYLATIEGSRFPFFTVSYSDQYAFINGLEFDINYWKQIKAID